MRSCAEEMGFREIITPEFEDTRLFVRGVGTGTDIVNKEMYSFSRSEGESFTLKPEGTSPVVRAYIQNGMSSQPQPVKLFYLTSCYRAERPQKGRQRQFHQFGVELLGSSSAYADAEVILLANEVLKRLAVKNTVLNINSVGCPQCRAEYYRVLREFLADKTDKLCADCRGRIDTNPMRVLDCKNESCREILADAPLMKDYLCEKCAAHFALVQQALDAANVAYIVNPRIVRGLDYYTNTAFEFLCTDLGAQSAVAAGGRYDGLAEALGGEPTPGVGFGMGMERLSMLTEAQKQETAAGGIYIAGLGDAAQQKAFALCAAMIDAGFTADCDLMQRSLKAQMKYADKLGARYVYMIGEDELASGSGILRDMLTKEQTEVPFGDFRSYMKAKIYS